MVCPAQLGEAYFFNEKDMDQKLTLKINRADGYNGSEFWADGKWWTGIGDTLSGILNGTASIIQAKNGTYPDNASTAYIQGSYDNQSNTTKYLIFGGAGLILLILIVLLVSRK